MLYVSLKRGIFLVLILTTVVLFLMANHLFKGTGISILDSDMDPVQAMLPSKEIRHIQTASTVSMVTMKYNSVNSEDMFNMKLLHKTGGSKDGVNEQEGSRNATKVAVVCNDALCTNYLSSWDTKSLFQCQRNATKKMRHFIATGRAGLAQGPPLISLHRDYSTGALISGKCQFMEGKGRGPVGLVSFPGSGNTWVRGLLQKATEICTGAVYCDSMLRLGGFDGEGLQTSSVLVVKSHSMAPTWSKKLKHLEYKGLKSKRIMFDAVIFLVRNPFHALVSEWNRQLSSKYNHGSWTGLAHVESHGQEKFLTAKNWTNFVHASISRWSKTFEWITACPKDHKVLVVKYEDVRADMQNQVKRMLEFLQYDISDAELSRRLHGGGASVFRRPKTAEFEHYAPEQRTVVDVAILGVERLLLAKAGQSFGVEKYLSGKIEALPSININQ